LCGAVAVTVVITMGGNAAATADPVQDQQCQDRAWAKLHPQICYKYVGGPFGIGGGGGSCGGLCGIVRDVLGSIGL
jgi:hypothetical protein